MLLDVLPRGVALDALLFLPLEALLATRACSRECAHAAADDRIWRSGLFAARRTTSALLRLDESDRVLLRLREMIGGLEPGAAAATAVTRVLGDLAGAHPRRDRRPARSFAAFKAARGADAARRLAEARRRLECARRRAAAAAQSAATLERQLALDLAQLSAAPPCSAPPPPPPPRPPRRRSAMLAPGLTRALRGHECRPLLRERVHNGTCAHRSVVQALERYHQRCAALEAAAHDLARAAVCLNPQLMSHNTHLL